MWRSSVNKTIHTQQAVLTKPLSVGAMTNGRSDTTIPEGDAAPRAIQ